MGAERNDLARRFLERLGRLDVDAAVALVTPDYEGTAGSELPLTSQKRVYRGHDGLRAWIAETAERYGEYEVERLRFRDYGDALLVVGANRTSGQRNPFGSAEQPRTFVCVIRFSGGLIDSVHAYGRYEDALAAEGLIERSPASQSW
jgi:ketosteroid isomerase-like protein